MAVSKTNQSSTTQQKSNTTSQSNTSSQGGSESTSTSNTTGQSSTKSTGGSESTNSSTSSGQSSTNTVQNSRSVTTGHSVSKASGQVDAKTQAAYNKLSEGYQQSQAVSDAYNKLQQTLSNKPSDFASTYEDKLANIYDSIMNREKFSYNMNDDAVYQMYKDLYTNQGKQAMKDTQAQAAQLTGGYGNTYAQTAGQQAYQNYLDQLNAMVPELRNQAYNEYMQEGENLYKQASLTNELYNKDYEKYRDTVSDWQSDRAFDSGEYKDERSFDYGKYNDYRNYIQSEYWNQKNAEHTTDSQSVTDTTSTSSSNTNSMEQSLAKAFSNSWNNSDTTSSQNSTSKSNSTSWENSNTNSTSSTNTTGSTNTSSSTVSDSGGSGGGGGRSSGKSSKTDAMERTEATLNSKNLADLKKRYSTGASKNVLSDQLYKYYQAGNISAGDYVYLMDELGYKI